jgi:hypothetical protein
MRKKVQRQILKSNKKLTITITIKQQKMKDKYKYYNNHNNMLHNPNYQFDEERLHPRIRISTLVFLLLVATS